MDKAMSDKEDTLGGGQRCADEMAAMDKMNKATRL